MGVASLAMKCSPFSPMPITNGELFRGTDWGPGDTLDGDGGNDSLFGGLGNDQATVGLPLIGSLHRIGQALGETHRILLQLGDAVALARVVRIQAEGWRERTHHFVEKLAGRGVVEISEIEDLAGLQIRGRDEVLHEQDGIDDLQRVGTARHGTDLRAEEAIIPIDFRLRAEAVVGQLFQRDEKGGLLRTRLSTELEPLPALLDERIGQAITGENRLRVEVA